MKPLPLPLRVAAGLAVTAAEQARELPKHLVGLPVTVLSQVLQFSMRLQQQVTELAIKGDEALSSLRPVEETPSWATFDEDLPPAPNGTHGRNGFRPVSMFTEADEGARDPWEQEERALAEDHTEGEFDSETTAEPAGTTARPGDTTAAGPVDTADTDPARAAGTDPTGKAGSGTSHATGPRPSRATGSSAVGSTGADATDTDPTGTGGTGSIGTAGTSAEGPTGTRPGDGPAATGPIGTGTGPAGAANRPTRAANGSAGTEPAAVGGPGAAGAAGTGAAGATGAGPIGIANYDALTLPQLRARLRRFSLEELEELLAYERANENRPSFVGMLTRRIGNVQRLAGGEPGSTGGPPSE